jgi:ubiquinone/menaquinone biosynthesis C-methylase UbiE
MPFYDFFWRNKQVTGLGNAWMKQASRFTLDRVSEVVAPLQSVVEIGPGWGGFALVCRERGLKYTAIDANAGLLNRLGSADGVCSFVPPIPIRDTVCDAIVANHVFEHVGGFAQARAFLSEMYRTVRPGGCVALTSPDILWYKNFFWDCDYSHSFPTSARRLHHMFLDQGLEVVHLEYVHNHLTGLKGLVVGQCARMVPYRLLNAQPNSPFYVDQIYKGRLTFSRAVLIIGRRPLE